jgi:tetratricopeptide (TPR) repeat protein
VLRPLVFLLLPLVAFSAPDDSALKEAGALLATGRLPEALAPLETLHAASPQSVEVALLLARTYNGVGRRDQGIALLEPFVAAHPDNPQILGLYAGQCMLRAGELGASFRALRLARRGSALMERAVVLAPGDISYREGLVDFYRQAPAIAGGGLEKARAHADAIARLDPVRGAAWQASILMEEKRYADALAACEAALAVRPDDYVALFTLGRTVSESGLRLDDGDSALRRCLAMTPKASEPSHAGVWYRIGLIAEKKGDLSAARSAYQASLEREPTFNRPAEGLARLDASAKQGG